MPCLSKVAPNSDYYGHVHRAGGIPAIIKSCAAAACSTWTPTRSTPRRWPGSRRLGHPRRQGHRRGHQAVPRRARRRAHHRPFSTDNRWGPRRRRRERLHPLGGARTPRRAACVLRGNIARDGAVLKTAGITRISPLEGVARVVESQEGGGVGDLTRTLQPGEVLFSVRGPRAARMGNAAPDGVHQGRRSGQVRPGHRRPLPPRFLGPSISHVSPRPRPAATSPWSATVTR